MSATNLLEDILRQAEQLPREQRVLLVDQLIHGLRSVGPGAEVLTWEELAGSAPYPLCGEDAQVWVSRGRSHADEVRKAG